MDGAKSLPQRSKLARGVIKVLHLNSTSLKDSKKLGQDKSLSEWLNSFDKPEEEGDASRTTAFETLIAELFARISSIKAAYSQLQFFQSPYNPSGIQSADSSIIKEFKQISNLKHLFLKDRISFLPDSALAKAEAQELKSVAQTFDIMCKKLDSQIRLKDSEIIYLKENLQEILCQHKELERRVEHFSLPDNLTRENLNPGHFAAYLTHAVKSIRRFVKLMVGKMRDAGWDLHAAAASICPRVAFWREDDKCFAFESYVSRVIFDAFHLPWFAIAESDAGSFFDTFVELKSQRTMEFLCRRPQSAFATFCRKKYVDMIHPKMEKFLFGSGNVREGVMRGTFPTGSFFAAFAEMARRVWLLHCMGFAFQPEVSIFQVRNGCRFSEVYMESVVEETLIPAESDPPVAFTVVPGFRVYGTIIQSQVYLAPIR